MFVSSRRDERSQNRAESFVLVTWSTAAVSDQSDKRWLCLKSLCCLHRKQFCASLEDWTMNKHLNAKRQVLILVLCKFVLIQGIIYILHLSDTFIQSDLQCIHAIHLFSVYVFPGNQTLKLCAANTMLYHWGTGSGSIISSQFWLLSPNLASYLATVTVSKFRYFSQFLLYIS